MKIGWRKQDHDIEEPNICPFCYFKVSPTFQGHYICSTENSFELISIWLCTNNKCNRLFVGQHKLLENNEFKLIRLLNGLPKGPEWPSPISNLKTFVIEGDEKKEVQTKFIKTYLQSLEAENSGLDEITGMGYRKAIEYLVKDWAIKNKPEDKEEIKKLWLGEVINKYFTGELKEILERATWLGNDQAHYLKLFEEFDIHNLKELIDLIVTDLDREHKKEHYIKFIQKKT